MSDSLTWTAARQSSLPVTISKRLFKLMSIESMMPSNHLILCRPLLLPSIFPSIRVFPMSWFYASGGQSIGVSALLLPKNIQDWFPLGLTGLISLQSRGSQKSTNYYPFLRCYVRRQWHPTPVLLPGKSHGWRSREGCSPWGRWESDTTERLHFGFSLSCIGEGNGNPLQCSCLENPRDGGAWWAAVYGVAQSWTQLKWLSRVCTWDIVMSKIDLTFPSRSSPSNYCFQLSMAALSFVRWGSVA